MIKTVLFENEPSGLQSLKKKIDRCCPSLKVSGMARTVEDAIHILKSTTPDLMFINPISPFFDLIKYVNDAEEKDLELIFVSASYDYTVHAIQLNAAGYLSHPLQHEAFMEVIAKVKERIKAKEEARKNRLLVERLLCDRKAKELVGIPTMEGYEFVKVGEIVRCEGLQKCTRVVTITQTDIVSSYNIGEFIKLLEPYRFFSPHKSHLINLSYVRRYLREGTIVLIDKTCIPVAKRRKSEFLRQVVHL